MSKYCIAIDARLCSGLGACVDLAPALFRLEAGGVAAAVDRRDGRSRRARGSRRNARWARSSSPRQPRHDAKPC